MLLLFFIISIVKFLFYGKDTNTNISLRMLRTIILRIIMMMIIVVIKPYS